MKCVSLTKEAVGGCRKPREKKTARNKKKCRKPCEKNSFCGNKKTCRKPCKNEAKGVIKEASENYVEKGAVRTKRPVGHPVIKILKNRLQKLKDLWKVAGNPAVKKAMGKDRI
jgi:hypothetical protein